MNELKEKPNALLDAFRVQHEQWVNSNVTKSFLKCLELHKQKFVKQMADNVENSSLDNEAFRRKAVSIKNTDFIINLATDVERFIIALTEQKQPNE